jgi:hypothetical protein
MGHFQSNEATRCTKKRYLISKIAKLLKVVVYSQ